jgi:integrase
VPTTSTRPYTPKPRIRPAPPAVLFGDFAAEWMRQQRVLVDGGLLRISALHRCQSALRAHLLPFFGARPLPTITREQCDGFRIAASNVGRLHPGTVNSVVQILRLILRAAHRQGLIDRDPLLGMRPLRVTPRIIDPYDQAEVDRLIEATDPAQRVVVALAALAGLRQGEVLAISPSDVDLSERRLLVRRSLQRHHPEFTVDQRFGPPKTAAGYREVPLQSRLRPVIEQHLEHHWTANRYDLLCPAPRGDPHDPIAFQRRIYEPAIRAAGLRPMRFHDLRRSFVAQCVSAGIPVAQTAAWLGHTIRMTERYYQEGHAQLVTAIARLDEAPQ